MIVDYALWVAVLKKPGEEGVFDEVYFVLSWSEGISCRVERPVNFFFGRWILLMDVMSESDILKLRVTRMSKNGIALSCLNSMVN